MIMTCSSVILYNACFLRKQIELHANFRRLEEELKRMNNEHLHKEIVSCLYSLEET